MGKIIQIDEKRTDNRHIKIVQEAATAGITSTTVELCVSNIHDQFTNIINAKAQMQLAVDTIYNQFKADGVPELELDMQTHDINKTIHDLDTAEGSINKFLDYIRDKRKQI